MFCTGNYLELMKFEWNPFFLFIAEIELFYAHKMYMNILWLGFLLCLLMHQLAIMLLLTGMLTTGRTYQQVINSENYLHMYKIVKNKQ